MVTAEGRANVGGTEQLKNDCIRLVQRGQRGPESSAPA